MSTASFADEIALHWRALARQVTHAQPWFELACGYAAHRLAWQAAYAAQQAQRLDASLVARLREVMAPLGHDATNANAALGQAVLPQAEAMASRFSEWLQACPGDWLTWLYLTRLLELAASASPDEALLRAEALEPIAGESRHWLGVWRLNAGHAQAAVDALAGLVDVKPMRHGSMMYLGEALLRVGKVVAAEKAFSRASMSGSAEFLMLLAARVHACNYWQEEIAVLRKAIAIDATNARAWLAMARIQSEVYLLSDCRESLGRVRQLDPDNAEARLLEAGLHGRHGNAREHLQALQAQYESAADPHSRLASSIAMTALYHDGLAPREMAALHRRLCAPIESALQRPTAFTNALTPSRRLRIGFVTGDLHRQHPVNLFMLPILKRLDHERFEVCIYHSGGMQDDCTRQARGCADRWLDAGSLDDAALRQAIIADQVDILIDLAGHTAGHRLGVFAMRAAPVQATFLGYPHSTGLSSIDWLIGDRLVSPDEHAELFSERLARMPDCVFCWAPVDAYPLPPPRPAAAPVVFGSFNNAMKLSPRTVALWAKVLHAVPGALLLLKAPSLRDEGVQAQLALRFAAHDIPRERLQFRGPTGLDEMMQEYGDIDVALDPTPYNGGTTSLQALWMGVPVVTLAGGNFPSLMGASFMTALGRPEWIALDEAGYVEAACELIRELAAWRSARAALRAQLVASPLGNIEAYVGQLQFLLSRMWQAHCEEFAAGRKCCML